MKILFAADGSRFTKKALAFLVTHDALLEGSSELQVLHVQPALPTHVKSFAGRGVVASYHLEEAEKVLEPIRKFLDKHPIKYKADWIIGNPALDIVKIAKRDNAHLIVMGTHGHGALGRVFLGSVAQKVVSECDRPVLLVK
jgi:nucleotide-binding universal stress UspA family protein